jgi:ATP-dependent helicase/nuclease subunit A
MCLIDEAQDTSPRQWDIVARIISEFTSGAGARDGVLRTVFAVGDEKQSIFSFQGAAPVNSTCVAASSRKNSKMPG